MANKNKKKRRRPPPASAQGPTERRPQQAGGGATPARRDRKDQARRAREAERRRRSRQAAIRRFVTVAVVLAIGLGAFYFLTKVASPRPIPDAALAAAEAAGCTDVEHPAADAPGGIHAAQGEQVTYTDQPATSGRHDPSPLPGTPRVYTQPVNEAQAVHSLEHGSVIAYYRLPGEGGVSQETVDALAPVANASKASYLIPYAAFPDGQSFAVTAWNTRVLCPGTITPDQATTLFQGLIDAYACTANAPEGNLGDGC